MRTDAGPQVERFFWSIEFGRRTRSEAPRWTRSHVVFAVSGLAAWYVCYATFRNLKSYVPFVHGHLYDDTLERIDHAVWLGHEPANVLHAWFGTTWAAESIEA